MKAPYTAPRLIGGRLAIDFANRAKSDNLSWETLIIFFEQVRITSAERTLRLQNLPQSDPQSADQLLQKARRLSTGLEKIFTSMVRTEKIARDWTEPINEILRITEGHDELVQQEGVWRMEFVAREGGLDWLLAAIARSAAELVAEGSNSRIRICANANCGLFFYDNSRTRQRRWCSMSVCGNRSKVATFARKRAAHA
jgi:predicted RNA-binding Zn ribbon-like protein